MLEFAEEGELCFFCLPREMEETTDDAELDPDPDPGSDSDIADDSDKALYTRLFFFELTALDTIEMASSFLVGFANNSTDMRSSFNAAFVSVAFILFIAC